MNMLHTWHLVKTEVITIQNKSENLCCPASVTLTFDVTEYNIEMAPQLIIENNYCAKLS